MTGAASHGRFSQVSRSSARNHPVNAGRAAVPGPCRCGDCALEWVDWSNIHRLLAQVGNIPPAETGANFYEALEIEDMAA